MSRRIKAVAIVKKRKPATIAKKLSAEQVRKINLPSAAEEKDKGDILATIERHTESGNAPQDGKLVDVDPAALGLDPGDLRAAGKVAGRGGKAAPAGAAPKGKPGKQPGKDTPAADLSAKDMLRPDAIAEFFKLVNAQLQAAGSIWAASPMEQDLLVKGSLGMIDKYFPDLEEYDVEAAFLLAVGLYAGPRIYQIYIQHKLAAAGAGTSNRPGESGAPAANKGESQ